ncbi:hypothetical protein FBUS_11610 [Fasciolopsis buskii]|uniref:GH18 domain-containing protein n=1 Tax=Fasciolopsis buskii TaxID=27845 RepID=A0A8E0VN31_9TREM|nr:hypothetical protein FBUS_11610 [Fasciolopsis buski]
MHLLCYILLLFYKVGLGLCFEQLLHPSKNIDVDQFLDSHSAYNKYAVDRKEFNSTTLAYVTPVFFEFTSFILVLQWNKLGYEVAETFTHKFNLLAPVWFQVLGKKKSYTVTGVPNIDKVGIIVHHIIFCVRDMIAFLRLLAEDIHSSGKLLILVIPPGSYRGGYVGRFTKTHFDQLYGYVDYFSLMTYDFSAPNK